MALLYQFDWSARAAWMPWLSTSHNVQLWRQVPGVRTMSALSSSASVALNKLTEHDARTLLLELGTPAVLKSFDRDCQQRYAAELLGQGCTRATTRNRLMQRYQISMRSAYRLIDNVIQNCAKTGRVLANTGRILNALNQYGAPHNEHFSRFNQSTGRYCQL